MRSTGLALLGALMLTAAVAATTALTPDNRGFGFDGMFYAAMAGHPQLKPEYAHVGPWAYRVATPAVAGQLPWDTLTNFRVLAFVATVGTLVLMFLILEQLGFAPALCWLGMLLYAGVFWAVKFACYTPGYIDAETQLMLVAIVYLVLRRSNASLIVVMVAAVLVKESLIAFALFAATALYRQQGGRMNGRLALLVAGVVIAPLLALGLVHVLVPTVTSIDTSAELREQLRLLTTAPYWAVLMHSQFSGLGLLVIIAALRPRRWIAFAREHYEWIVYVAIALLLLFGGLDKGRLFLYLLPAAVVCAVLAIDDLDAVGRGVPGWTWLVILLLAHFFIGHYLTPMDAPDNYLAKLVPEHSVANHLPYLWRNLAISAGLIALTFMLLSRKRGDA